MFPLNQSVRVFVVLLWVVGIAGGIAYAWKYQFTDTASIPAAVDWPQATSCSLADDRPTLIMFLHPCCVCSRASLRELDALLRQGTSRPRVELLFRKTPATADNGSCTDLWDYAGKLPGVERRVDQGSEEQRRFGANVSGELFAYRPDGKLFFHGGITAGRGHEGDNAARSALAELLRQPGGGVCSMPIFGCALGAPIAAKNQLAASQRELSHAESQ